METTRRWLDMDEWRMHDLYGQGGLRIMEQMLLTVSRYASITSGYTTISGNTLEVSLHLRLKKCDTSNIKGKEDLFLTEEAPREKGI